MWFLADGDEEMLNLAQFVSIRLSPVIGGTHKSYWIIAERREDDPHPIKLAGPMPREDAGALLRKFAEHAHALQSDGTVVIPQHFFLGRTTDHAK